MQRGHTPILSAAFSLPARRLSAVRGRRRAAVRRSVLGARRPAPPHGGCDDRTPGRRTRCRPPRSWDRWRIDHAPHARVHQGHGAHAARLQGHVEGAAGQAVARAPAGVAQGDDFRVGAGVVLADRAVPALAEHDAVLHQHRAHRHLPSSRARSGASARPGAVQVVDGEVWRRAESVTAGPWQGGAGGRTGRRRAAAPSYSPLDRGRRLAADVVHHARYAAQFVDDAPAHPVIEEIVGADAPSAPS